MRPSVYVIVLNWNGKADTLACLDSLRADRYSRTQIVVVDNGSRDGSASAIRQAFPEVTVLETGVNLGFSGGNNEGIRYALANAADFAWILNNDTVVGPDAITALVDAAFAAPACGVLTPVIHYFDHPEQPWFAGSRLDLRSGSAVHDNSHVPDAAEAVGEIPWATGCAMFMRAEVMRELGGFDERYFLNWEDVDLSLRARALGWKLGVVPGARIYHKVSRSFTGLSRLGTYYHVRNNLLFLRTHGGAHHRTAALAVLATRARERLLAFWKRNPDAIPCAIAMVKALWDHLLQRYGHCSSI